MTSQESQPSASISARDTGRNGAAPKRAAQNLRYEKRSGAGSIAALDHHSEGSRDRGKRKAAGPRGRRRSQARGGLLLGRFLLGVGGRFGLGRLGLGRVSGGCRRRGGDRRSGLGLGGFLLLAASGQRDD